MRSHYIISVLLLSLTCIVACNIGPDNTTPASDDWQQETGSVAIQIDWPDTRPASLDQRQAPINCHDDNVKWISAKVSSDSKESINSGLWECEDKKGTIEGVPIGDNYTVTLFARNSDHELVFHGEKNSVSVQAGENSVYVKPNHVIARSISKVDNVNPGTGITFPHHMFETKGQLYFIGLESDSGFEIYVSDPDEGGARLLKDIYSDNDEVDGYGLNAPSDFTDTNDWIYFRANGASGEKLWRSDGTTANTEPITTSSEYFNPTQIKVLNNHIFFVADSEETGMELRVYDENSSQIIVKDIQPGKKGSNPNQLTVVGDTLFFVADDGEHGHEIWSIDTAEATAKLAKDIDDGHEGSYPRELIDVGGRLFFIADDGPQDPEGTPPTYGMEIWMMYETPQGIETHLAADLNMTDKKNGARDIKNLTWLYDTALAFSVHLEQYGQELYLYNWQTDTAPRRITDLNPGPRSSHPANIVYLNDTIYFTAYNENSVEHLWACSPDQGSPPKAITENTQLRSPKNLTVFNQTLYFTALNESDANESDLRILCAYDGSRTGMVMGNANETETTQHSPANLIAAADRLYYSAFTKDDGVKLFQIMDP